MMIKFGKKNNQQPLFYILERVRHKINERIEKRERKKEEKNYESSKLHRSSSANMYHLIRHALSRRF